MFIILDVIITVITIPYIIDSKLYNVDCLMVKQFKRHFLL